MPVSDIRWSLSHQLPVFAVYGTKRKIDWQNEPEQNIDSEGLVPVKKLCSTPDVPENGMNDLLTQNVISDNSPANQENNQQSHAGSIDMESSDHELCNWNNNAFCPQQQPPVTTTTQNNSTFADITMDLAEETHTNTQLPAEAESMHNNMDSDCVPDYQQYKMVFCDPNCVGGDKSPTSGRVRCYCKPSWEGLDAPRPYVSDYY